MISDKFTVGTFNVKHKDGYDLVSENKVSENGKVYETEVKTFAHAHYANEYMIRNGVKPFDSDYAIQQARLNYYQKASKAHIKQMEKAKAAKLKKEMQG